MRRETKQAAGTARHNFYATVHKGLRACLVEALVTSGRTDPSDDGEVAQLAARVRSLCALYRLHAAKEDRFVHPTIKARRPGSSQRTAADHLQHSNALDRLEAHVRELEAATGGTRAAATQTLYNLS